MNNSGKLEMGNISVSKDKQEALQKRMESLGIFEKDIVEKFIRSSGKGGQKVNKASTCVYLKHLPTQIEVKCQRERYQALNRYLARRILTGKIEEMIKGKESEEQQRIEKIRRQKRKR
jgi:protein subunit release factor B